MELLVLGGTSFAGRHVVEQALLEGHHVTTFNRGHTNPELFPEVRKLHGDRSSGDYAALDAAGPFDAVVDVSAYFPRAVREAIRALSHSEVNGPYILISSISVYGEPQGQVDGEGFTETSPLAALPAGVDPATEDVNGGNYGPLKVLAEEEAKKHLPAGVMVIRPGLIVGPHDPTDRFTYWVRRMAEGGEVLAPEGPTAATTQVIDARDLARWIVHSASAARVGTFNAVAPPVPLTAVLEAAPGEADVTWVPWEFLEAHAVQPWTDLPAWVPAPMRGMILADGSKAAAAGLETRPIKATVADLAEWDRERPQAPLRAGLTREREAELLRSFRAEGRPPGP